jgi:hypothetical protein
MRSNVAIYRYEDIIFNKREWLNDVAEWYGWDIGSDAVSRILSAVDIVPSFPDASRHIRQVRPGDHQRALSLDTQRRLTRAYSMYLKLFGYLSMAP